MDEPQHAEAAETDGNWEFPDVQVAPNRCSNAKVIARRLADIAAGRTVSNDVVINWLDDYIAGVRRLIARSGGQSTLVHRGGC